MLPWRLAGSLARQAGSAPLGGVAVALGSAPGGSGAAALPALLALWRPRIDVTVPPLGDSISEGSISAVLKQAGERVAENDTIAQIETDKVTIDIKAPCDGTVVGFLVQVEDTVTPGQLIATVDESGAAAPAAAAAPSAASAAPPAPGAAAAAAAPGPAAAHAGAARVPGIHFPPRATPEGLRISSLPAAEALQWLQRLAGVGGGGGGAPAPASAAAAAAAPVGGAAQAVSASSAALGRTARAKVVTSSRVKEQSKRTQLTERELEAIMLGGAMD